LYSTTRVVEFRDTDAAGIVHFSAFFPMMESAEHEMLRSLGMSVMPPRRSVGNVHEPCVTWPRVSAKCDYVDAARFEDRLRIDVCVVRIGNSSIEYEFRFQRSDDGIDQTIAVGRIVAVCCRLENSGLSKVPISDADRQTLSTHLISAAE
jgi:YbgC/YbaW family acyl-CoA thioester hydrolase